VVATISTTFIVSADCLEAIPKLESGCDLVLQFEFNGIILPLSCGLALEVKPRLVITMIIVGTMAFQ